MIEDLKNIYVRAAGRRNEWRKLNPKIKLPPKYIEIRFCTWIQTAIYISKEENRKAIVKAMINLLSDKTICDKAASILRLVNNDSVIKQFNYIKEKFEWFVKGIRISERYSTDLIKTVEIVELLRKRLDEYVVEEKKEEEMRKAENVIEDELHDAEEAENLTEEQENNKEEIAVKNTVEIVRDKFEQVFRDNTGYIAIKDLVLNEKSTLNFVNMSDDEKKLVLNGPGASSDPERCFS